MGEEPDPHGTNYELHTDAQLREGVEKADREAPRIAEEDSPEAMEANREQRTAMSEELERRRGGGLR